MDFAFIIGPSAVGKTTLAKELYKHYNGVYFEQNMVKEYQRRRDHAVNAINDIPGLHCECPKGAFYIFINCKSLNMKSADLAAYLLENAKIALVPGDVFGPCGEGYLRMSFANSYENVVEGCEQLRKAVEQLHQKA